jgi:hypothetical protein
MSKILLSIHLEYVYKIIERKKFIELRKGKSRSRSCERVGSKMPTKINHRRQEQ